MSSSSSGISIYHHQQQQQRQCQEGGRAFEHGAGSAATHARAPPPTHTRPHLNAAAMHTRMARHSGPAVACVSRQGWYSAGCSICAQGGARGRAGMNCAPAWGAGGWCVPQRGARVHGLPAHAALPHNSGMQHTHTRARAHTHACAHPHACSWRARAPAPHSAVAARAAA